MNRFAIAAAILSVAAAIAPAQARDNGTFGTTITKEQLEATGYSCRLESAGVWRCTSTLDPAGYVCTINGCTSLPNRFTPVRTWSYSPAVYAPAGGLALSQ